MLEQGVTVMHQNSYWIFVVGTAVLGLGGMIAMQAAPRYPACAEIRAACKQAGFVRGRAKTGEGIFVDCIAPIMRRAPQPRRASKPLPQNQPAACGRLQSAESELRPKEPQRPSAIATGRAASPDESAAPTDVKLIFGARLA